MIDIGKARARFEFAKVKLMGAHQMYLADDDEIAREAGYRDISEFWQEFLALTLTRTEFATILESTLQSPQQFADEKNGLTPSIHGFIDQALQESFRTNQSWWVIPPDVDGKPQERQVRVREAVAWFLEHPHYRDRVPESLRAVAASAASAPGANELSTTQIADAKQKFLEDERPRRSKRGRPEGTSLRVSDWPLVDKMEEMIRSGSVPSPTAAARRLVDNGAEVLGSGTEESKIRRMVRRHTEKYGE